MMPDLSPHIGDIARHLLGEPNRQQSNRHQLRFGSNGSIAVEIAGPKCGTWYDHENEVGGSAWELLRRELKLDDAGIRAWLERKGIGPAKANGHSASAKATIVAEYNYCDEKGELLFQVVRLAPKTFRQRRPDGKGGWIWNTEGVRMVPYRLPELLAVSAKRNGHPTRVYIVEGEKDADCLTTQWGLLSTTNPRGAGKWRKDFSRYFSGFDVVITPDNDDAGRKHAHDVATSLCSVAASVRIVELGGLPEKGDISDWIANGATQSDLETLAEITPPFRPSGPIPTEDADDPLLCEHPASQPISSIPPRQWAYGHFLLFGHAAVLGAVDGGGKGAHATAIALSMITGRPLLGERVWRAGAVAIITYEDDQIEWCRRIAAACLHYDINYETVITSFYFLNRSRSRIRLAAHSPTGDIVFPDGDDIIARLNTIGAVLLIVDPFNHAHSTEDGNNNAVIAQVAGEVTRITHESGTAGLVLHHLRKGSTGNPDDLMGTTSLRATFRCCRILAHMTEEEAKRLNVPKRQAWRHSRIAATKENYAPPPELASWYRFESVALDNSAGIYTDGDNVQVITAWTPPSAFEGVSLEELADIFAKLRIMPGEGLRYSPDRRSDEWVGHPIAQVTGKTDDEVAHFINTWTENAVLIEDKYRHPKKRKLRSCITLNAAKVAEILAPLHLRPETDE